MFQCGLLGPGGHSSVCRTPYLFLVTQTAVQKCSFWKRMIILFHFHIHTKTSTYADFQAGVCTGTLIQKRTCKTQTHSSQRAHLLTRLFCILFKHHILHFCITFHFIFLLQFLLINSNFSNHLPWMPPRDFSLGLCFILSYI